MRQMIVTVPRGCGSRVLSIAGRHGGTNVAAMAAEAEGRPVDLVIVHTSNAKVEGLLGELEGIPDLYITLAPQGVITLKPPASEAPDQATDIEPRSPIEVVLSGLQSVGSWKGFLSYAAAAGIVVWIGLFTETIYLLTAAMLIAPFAGPAMNAALATARGDVKLFGRSLGRYFAALVTTIAITFILSMIMQQQIATGLMIERSFLSSVAVLLPLSAGAAGALNLCQSERSSLVSGAATGMLVAASLAPPAGLVGMGAAIGEWDIVGSAAFVLLLQIVGINVSGAIVFRLYGISPQGVRYKRGRSWFGILAWAGALVATVALVTWQFSEEPNLLRSSQAQRATADVRQVVQESGLAQLVQASAQFTRADIPGQNTMLVTLYVQTDNGDAARVRQELSAAVKQVLAAKYDAVPLVDVTVLEK
ncbi:DUF389 domain-containing protein [Microvirga sp. GCM10011540]|uniref:DUF389 domain-containing protein n=1 Tax=Microvirga sp. GCM10011540 TaxID=3317338 RepID=UPI0036111DCD